VTYGPPCRRRRGDVRTDGNADHFLIFTEREKVLAKLER
jgi:hypothetical protein